MLTAQNPRGKKKKQKKSSTVNTKMKKQQRVIPGDIDNICDLHRLRVVLKEGNKNHLTLIQLQERYTRILLTMKKKENCKFELLLKL